MTPTPMPIPPRRPLPLAVLSVLVAVALGCASPQSAQRGPAVQVLPDGSRIVCAMERPTGSHIAEEVCRRVVPASAARAHLENELVKPKSAAMP